MSAQLPLRNERLAKPTTPFACKEGAFSFLFFFPLPKYGTSFLYLTIPRSDCLACLLVCTHEKAYFIIFFLSFFLSFFLQAVVGFLLHPRGFSDGIVLTDGSILSRERERRERDASDVE